MLISVDPICVILRILTILVRTLDASARRCIIPGNSESDGRAVTKFNGLLNQSFTKRTTAYDCATIIVLDSARKNLAGRGRTLVDQHYQWHTLTAACSICIFFHSRIFATLSEEHQSAFWKEFIHHTQGCIHIAACIVAQVNDESFAVLVTQLCNGIQQFYMCGTCKFIDFHIAEFIVYHIDSIDGVLGNITSHHDEVQ